MKNGFVSSGRASAAITVISETSVAGVDPLTGSYIGKTIIAYDDASSGSGSDDGTCTRAHVHWIASMNGETSVCNIAQERPTYRAHGR